MDSDKFKLIHCSTGRDHTALVYQDRETSYSRVVLLGNSRLGQLGPHLIASNYNIISFPESFDDDGTATIGVETTWSGTYILRRSSAGSACTLQGFGSNSHNQLAKQDATVSGDSVIPLESERLRKIVCGSEHVLVLDDERRAYGWGWNEHGNIGNGENRDVQAPIRLGEELPGTIIDVWAGNATSWILVDDNAPI
jgi:protein ATS1